MPKMKNNPRILRKAKLIHSSRRYDARKLNEKRYRDAKIMQHRSCAGFPITIS